ncbi:GLPGLI family protein [Chitinophaga sp. 30R24]|uniref:GLPGLI family protein n=1 Tax=Chitinophaga sp. 30R24 TaxID=3248838 RepID=UPI003B90A1E0
MRYCLIFLFALISQGTLGQSRELLREGTIVFERRENLMYLKRKQILQETNHNNANFRSLYFELSFNPRKSVYKPVISNATDNSVGLPGEDNIVFQDVQTEMSTIRKNVLGQFFLLKKPFSEARWKLTEEKRIIAGFECKRANAIIMDSIYAIAFYTDDIVSSLGPESFMGLPGMILGLVLPHKHVSWFAIKVNATAEPDEKIAAPDKGIKKTTQELKEIIQKSIGTADPQLQEYLYLYLL